MHISWSQSAMDAKWKKDCDRLQLINLIILCATHANKKLFMQCYKGKFNDEVRF